MLSFFSRRPLFYNTIRHTFYDPQLSKYVIDTTNQVKKEYQNVTNTNILKQPVIENENKKEKERANTLLPIFSFLSFLAGYFFSKYNN